MTNSPSAGPANTMTNRAKDAMRGKAVQVKKHTKQSASDAGRAAWGDARSVLYRNRRQLAPVKLAGGAGVMGGAATLVAEHPDVSLMAATGGTGAVALAAGAVTIKKLGESVPTGFQSRFRWGVAAGCTWCTAFPLLEGLAPGSWPGMLLALGLGTVSLSARWWQRIRPNTPRDPRHDFQAAEQAAEKVAEDPNAAMALSDRKVMDRWKERVGASDGALPGSEIGAPTKFAHGRSFEIQLVSGKQTIDEARGAIAKIASGLKIPQQQLVIESADEEDPTLVELRVVDKSPIKESVFFDKPRYKDGYAEIGPYADGQGSASFALYSDSGIESGYVLGSKGSGKSRVLESIAITAMSETPTVVVYLDGQDGASSPLLWENALWRGGPDHAEDISQGLVNIMKFRNRYNRFNKLTGFTPTKEMPGILVVVDECHRIFDTHGKRFADIAREGRKLGLGILAASQDVTMNAFGSGGDALRSNLIASNGIALRTLSTVMGTVFPGLKVDLTKLPKKPGYGYTVDNGDGGHRTAQFRARWLVTDEDRDKVTAKGGSIPSDIRTAEEWFAKVAGDQELDAKSAQHAGPAFLERHERAAREQAELAAMFDSDDVSALLDDTKPSLAATAAAAGSMSLPTLGTATVTPLHRDQKTDLSTRQQDILELLRDNPLHTNDIAEHFGVSAQTIRSDIGRLGDTRLEKVSNGVYRSKEQ